MNVVIDTEQSSPCDIPKSFFQDVAKKSLERLARPITAQTVVISVGFLLENEIQTYNRKWRGKDTSTDILSFPTDETPEALFVVEGGEYHLGDLLVCCPVIKKYAMEDDVTIPHEMAYIFSHGVLHLAGYDHTEEMFQIQDDVADYYRTTTTFD